MVITMPCFFITTLPLKHAAIAIMALLLRRFRVTTYTLLFTVRHGYYCYLLLLFVAYITLWRCHMLFAMPLHDVVCYEELPLKATYFHLLLNSAAFHIIVAIVIIIHTMPHIHGYYAIITYHYHHAILLFCLYDLAIIL